jgi:hypothetical protein
LTSDCNGCHSPNDWGGGALKKKVAAPAATRSTIAMVVGTGAAPRSAAGAGTGARMARLSHSGVTGTCVSCHNGVLATGKGVTHIASNDRCENCHTTFAWIPARFDHQGITASCASCHNGVQAPGEPARHIQTAQDCSACHGTISWQPATFSHLGINATCRSCHNGITATGKQVQHASTTLDCGICHDTLSWTVAAPPARVKPLIQSPRGASSGPTK